MASLGTLPVLSGPVMSSESGALRRRRSSIHATTPGVTHHNLEMLWADVAATLETRKRPVRSQTYAGGLVASPVAYSVKRSTSSPVFSGRLQQHVVSEPTEPPTSLLHVSLFAFALIASGLLTNIAFEALSKLEPGCSGVLTLCQYLFALVGGASGTRAHLIAPVIPLRWHLIFTLLMFLTAFCGNASVDYKLPFPLYLIIKSSNLVASMVVGAAFGKRYGRSQAGAVLAITIGVVMATLVSSASKPPPSGASSEAGSATMGGLLAGASLCIISTVCMALLGVAQERIFAKYGQHHEEAIFYIHALGLAPLVLLQPTSPLAKLHQWVADGAPKVWALLILNLVACQCCKRAFFGLLGRTSSLSATLGVLGYRFFGILLSACWINAPPQPAPAMLFAIALVTAGCLAYLACSSSPATASSTERTLPRRPKAA